MVQATSNGSVVLVLGRTDVYDRRIPGSPFATGKLLCDVAKLPIGNLTLRIAGDVLSAKMRVRLWEGEVTITLNTTKGSIVASVFAFGGGSAPSGGGSGIIVVGTNTTGGEREASSTEWVFTAADANANAPHPVYKTESYACKSNKYKSNPPAVIVSGGGGDDGIVATSEQALLVGPKYATALGYHQLPTGLMQQGKGGTTLSVTVLATTAPLSDDDDAAASAASVDGPADPVSGAGAGATAVEVAVADARWALAQWTNGALVATHRAAWHTFYTTGAFLSLDHPKLEQFYWITQYKMGCGMGLRGDLAGDGGAMDHTSPWYLPNNGASPFVFSSPFSLPCVLGNAACVRFWRPFVHLLMFTLFATSPFISCLTGTSTFR
jgi:hypothetical protein